MPPVISVENLSKRYIIGHQKQQRDTTLRDLLSTGTKRLASKLRNPFSPSEPDPTREEFWALRDVSFDIQQGDRVGIIGRNGAGKSTLLKILSRITEPTVGSVSIRGRVASLLEVGTGFHPELTGRENIYLNGAILGMSRLEIKRRFDEIVAFAEVEKFLDTPVKRYSSGMYVRLAFAVAAHLEPEILIVDEVLAVGDAQFQKKCLGKMEHAGSEGRTVLFVSHNMNAMRRLCNKAVLLQSGRNVYMGLTEEACDFYLNAGKESRSANSLADQLAQLPIDPIFRLTSIQLLQEGELIGQFVRNGDTLLVKVEYEVKKAVSGLRVFVDVKDESDTLIFRTFHDEKDVGNPEMSAGKYESQLTLPRCIFAPKNYVLSVNAGIYNKRYVIPEGGIELSLNVIHTSEYNRAYPDDPVRGQLALVLNWESRLINAEI
jgi:lipopolysaccharide transport system ATP-binding protein